VWVNMASPVDKLWIPCGIACFECGTHIWVY
jgi:hypothetical protein